MTIRSKVFPKVSDKYNGPLGNTIPANAKVYYDYRSSDPAYAILEQYGRASSLSSTRADSVNVPQKSGAILSYGNNTAPLSIGEGVLVQGGTTNEINNSGLVGGGYAPTDWSEFSGGGTSVPETSSLFPSAIAYHQTASGARSQLAQSVKAVVLNDIYTFSIIIEEVLIAPKANQTISISGPSGSTLDYPVCEANPSGGAESFIKTGELLVTATSGGTGNLQTKMGLGTSSNTTGDITFSMPMLEEGLFRSSFELSPTSGTAARLLDTSTILTGNFLATDFTKTISFEFRGSNATDGRIAVSGTDFDLHYDDGNGRYELITALGTVVSNAISPSIGDQMVIDSEINSSSGGVLSVNGSSGSANASVTGIVWNASTMRYMNNLAGTAATNAVIRTNLIR